MKSIFFFCCCTILVTGQLSSIDPVREYTMTPDKFGLDYQTHKIPSTDSALLHCWTIPTTNINKKDITIVIVGSDAGNMGFALPYAVYLTSNGYDVLTFDYRGFGSSSNFEHQSDYLYHPEYIDDFTCTMKWARENFVTNEVAVLAFSMGTLIATAGYASASFDYLVGEAFIGDPQKVIERIREVKDVSLRLPTPSGLSKRNLANMAIPTLIFAGTLDSTTTQVDAEDIVAQQPNRHLIIFHNGHLKGAFTLGIDRYISEINNFLSN